MENTLYVAVGENVKESRAILLWALQNSGGKKICIIHVHQPAQMIPFMGTRWPASILEEQEVKAYRKIQRQHMNKILIEYISICRQMEVPADTLHTEMDCIEKGILKLISEHGIRELVMGAAANKHYSKKLINLKSKKAIFVCQKAPISCSVKFICKGHLIYTREGILNAADAEIRSSLLEVSQNTKDGPSMERALSSSVGQKNQEIPINPYQDSFCIETTYGSRADISSANGAEEFSSPWSRLNEQGSSDDCGRLSSRYPPSPGHSASQSCQVVDMDMTPSLRVEGVENGLKLSSFTESKEHCRHSSPLTVLQDRKTDDDALYDQIEKSREKAQNVKREALQVAAKRVKAERDDAEAIQRTKVLESFYTKELKQRKEIQEMLAREKEKLEMMKKQEDEVMEELHVTLDQKSLLENQIAETDAMVKVLGMRITSAEELLQTFKKNRDEVQIEHDNALKQLEELRRKQGEILGTPVSHFFSEFPYSEIKEATQNFDPSMKIGEGRSRSIYKGLLRHTQVAIKMPHNRSLQAHLGFHREVDILSKLRHPNLFTLIGSCQEAYALIYEYLPNGSLEDRLRCKDNTPPLSWQTRISIAAELCSVLIFLHSSKPIGIVHGDLTPSSILLDANLGSKLTDFGICHLLPHDQSSKNTNQGTFTYMDPEFLSTGELTLKSDVYSLGIILLELLTGRSALRIIKEVKHALDADKLKEVLDPLAGDWPLEQAEQVAHLALRCCASKQKNRPDLESEVWTLLEPMRYSCGGPYPTIQLGSAEEHPEPPPYLICPISQEIIRDAQVAADGYTYEAVALRKWLESGHYTSPMTNLKLEHCNLVPNHSLRSAIQECQNRHKKFKY
ncbi:hypothetical protein I3842_01G059200 [Carya illinoinensis]|uniref:RING-type E3 ubiquitin transferase n=2 Tax=Carya illinoinensis TaxID=32201 RepID=A0A922G0B3_CARIL|nr:hypothetical protein I3842_01G059200 [Carya illinoinensis]